MRARQRTIPTFSLLTFVMAAAAIAASCSGGRIGSNRERAESIQCLSEAGDLYEQRIAPILTADRPKTCNQCHLSGVDLSLFVRENACETRACLLELGLVNPENPDASPILDWIARASPDSELITEDVIAEEYEAFRAFVGKIATCSGAACGNVRCPTQSEGEACGRDLEPGEATLVAEETPCDALSMETAFRDTIYVWRERCWPCHFSNELEAAPTAPRWIDVTGGCDAASIATLHNIETSGYIDVLQPDQSLLLLKPLSLERGGVEHGGGEKFGGTLDRSYQSFLSFLEYYAACTAGATTP